MITITYEHVSTQEHKQMNKNKQIKNKYTKFYVHVTVHRKKILYNKTNQMHQFPKFTLA
jgi:hypothetical protein